MITKITDATTVKEIRELLEFIEEVENINVRIELWSDLSGVFTVSNSDNQFINLSDLPEYIKKHTKPEPNYDEILNDPKAKEKIIRSLPITDIVNEILRREEEKK